ncbi:hypothetical protein HN858_01550 [Candidatus Falkowbacteria bacterium]|jgi:hypothetical protein|nr:hypothetical protein [Candidatus Falkowbacteria bacterium]MBT5503785.1 hypothetical protein [Candidatus Falkowbacteria bacterium]MBT6573927.1 hypothetical protein [Candidatus Falkowbacteria bacterium]MBT7348338.1 hypothetical protein [Candidatus Falkowbacteria bacterium]MBT7500279.1 hypothetical protein [Candidatus Falkowbacteria bacterium]
MSNFPNFAGRIREKYRIWLHVAYLLKELFDDPETCISYNSIRAVNLVKKFLDKHYDEKVPYHGPIHVLYGLCYLLENQKDCDGSILFDICLRWLGHDASHNGNAVESPEEKSLGISIDEFNGIFSPLKIGLTSHYLPEYFKDILRTKFPYTLDEESPEDWVNFLRVLDTLRVAAGATSSESLGLDEPADPFLINMFESGALWMELGMTPEDWIVKGQLGFFFPHLFECLNGSVFQIMSDKWEHEDDPIWDQSNLPKLKAGVEANHQRLQEIVADQNQFQLFLRLINWSVHYDCTLPEYLAKAKEFGL